MVMTNFSTSTDETFLSFSRRKGRFQNFAGRRSASSSFSFSLKTMKTIINLLANLIWKQMLDTLDYKTSDEVFLLLFAASVFYCSVQYSGNFLKKFSWKVSFFLSFLLKEGMPCKQIQEVCKQNECSYFPKQIIK